MESTDELGRRRTFTYDAIGRKTKTGLEDSQVTFTYDNDNRLIGLNDTQSGVLGWTYDNAGRVLSATMPAGTVNYTYNPAGQRASMTVSEPAPRSFTPMTQAARLQAINQAADQFVYSYDTLSRAAGLTRPNAVTTSYSYDAWADSTGAAPRRTQSGD